MKLPCTLETANLQRPYRAPPPMPQTTICPEPELSTDKVATPDHPPYWLYGLFFLSGFPALIYQIVWQRTLFIIYGVNVESVTVVVTAFMLGLGLGSLVGG